MPVSSEGKRCMPLFGISQSLDQIALGIGGEILELFRIAPHGSRRALHQCRKQHSIWAVRPALGMFFEDLALPVSEVRAGAEP